MKAKKWSHGRIGSVSTATMRNEDLIPSFCEELRYLGHRSKVLTGIEREVNKVNTDKYYESEESSFDLESLFDMLNAHSLPYMYFGSHPGDGADYGFWLDWGTMQDVIHDGELLQVEDLAQIPVNHTGEVLLVNEKGNTTLYTCKRGKLREIWSIV